MTGRFFAGPDLGMGRFGAVSAWTSASGRVRLTGR